MHFFKEGHFQQAVDKYSKALRYLEEEFPSAEEKKEFALARVLVLLNRAACYNKLPNSASKAAADCEAVLAIDGDNAKAHFRLAQSLQISKDLEGAVKHFQRSATLQPDAGTTAALEKARKALAEERKKQSDKYKKMFG